MSTLCSRPLGALPHRVGLLGLVVGLVVAVGVPAGTAGHAGDYAPPVVKAAFSPDGKLVVTAGSFTARIWDAGSGDLLHNLVGRIGWNKFVAFSTDSRFVVTGGGVGTARVWNATSGRLLHALRGHTNEVASGVFSPDGKLVVTASYDGTARTWDVASGRLVRTLRGGTGAARTAAFSPNSKWVVSTRNARLGAGQVEHQRDVDGRLVVTASWDGTARIWLTNDGGATMGAAAAPFLQAVDKGL